ncbi:MAG: ornithine cyclodeaminase [Fulvimarina manganoxydans]|uniref:ornithine cyclodeaminase family protein n=1 Tax=Fulvimarina manganoxydans TaxID=937218 RepID=UPI002352AC20|nr:ornithine cyclodeaminase [Fulvimarina manganoxydans]MCK5932097.1 ornithine cyclodeaminase [Fulvimarina manganoxydans]
MIIVDFATGEANLTWTGIVEALEAGHRLPRAEIGDLLLGSGENRMLNRAAWIDGLGIAMKSVTVFAGNPRRDPALPSVQGGVLLFDHESGAPLALIDGPLVTKWKTAGDSLLGARRLARPDAKRLLVCGAGTLAKSLIEAYSAGFEALEDIRIWNRSQDRAEALMEEMGDIGARISLAHDLEEAVRESDIVSTATMASEPFLKGEWLAPGTHVDLIGAYRPDMREADDAVLTRGRLFVDSLATTIGHIGEIEIPLRAGTITRETILGDLNDIVAGTVGRQDKDDITVFKNGGGAHLDLMTARHILDRLDEPSAALPAG